jgi:hypothetical protein
MQQLFTMHWLHGVPPGLSMQLPASTGVPQCPLSQVRPTQQSLGVLQLEPGGRQPPMPHLPFWQALLQHCAGLVQEKPSMVHTPQTPAVQALLQHLPGTVHPAPSGKQAPVPHVKVLGLQ